MARVLMVLPVSFKVGLNTVTRGIESAVTSQKLSAIVFEPIKQVCLEEEGKITLVTVERFLSQNRRDDLLDKIVTAYEAKVDGEDIIIIKGLNLSVDQPYVVDLNIHIAKTFDADVILVGSPENKSMNVLQNQLNIAGLNFADMNRQNILGYILNKVPQNFMADSIQVFMPLLAMIPQLGAEAKDYETVAAHMQKQWINVLINEKRELCLSPPIFRYQLAQKARQANKCIILPEGDEPRTIKAAIACVQRGLARCILMGQKEAIYKIMVENKIEFDERVEILEPNAELREKYVEPLVEIRKHKGMTPELAREQLKDNVWLGTMMLELEEDVHGLVSGAVHTTSDTIRPAFQVIKMKKETRMISSVFFMCLPERMLVLGDCAVNPNPSAVKLADIAIQSAKSAAAFGIKPKVAMISYSTGNSGAGADVDKVKEATKIVKEKMPDLLIDGPLQYDAAIVPKVAKLKAPNSSVAGQASVLIFPDLNTGNTTYKAIQRSANVLCIGPMLQGLRKPVNDLSRGCLVKDIVFTIALTAVQAVQIDSNVAVN
jgi:phosphate acetyltransferase